MRRPPGDGGRNMLLLLLAWIGGYVDAVSYLGLGDVLTANMTGNTVLLGIALGQGRVLAAARSLTALAGFGLGVVAGALIAGRSLRHGAWSQPVTAAVSLECASLFALAAGWQRFGLAPGRAVYGLVALSALAMGLQSAAVRRVGVPDVATTYVTGTLAGVLERLVGARRDRPQASAGRGWRLPAAVWAVYGLGALGGGLGTARLHVEAFWPAAGVAALVVGRAVRLHRPKPRAL